MNGKHGKAKDKKEPLTGFLPCFSKHRDGHFPIENFYSNSAFVSKLKVFLEAIADSRSTAILGAKIHAKGGIQPIDPLGNSDDRKLCEKLGWQQSKVYRVDYGKDPYRLLFGLDNEAKRCYILALDSLHTTRPGKYK